MDLFLKYRVLLLRVIGGLLLLVSIILHFWNLSEPQISQNDLAAANVARMEASVNSSEGTYKNRSSINYIKELKEQQKQQLEYLTILVMFLGALSLGWSFYKRDEKV